MKSRRLVAIAVVLISAIGMVGVQPHVAQANGCGIPFTGTTYHLSTPNHFTLLSTCSTSWTYQLMNDVDLTGITVSRQSSFTGTFDGQGFTIRNMTVTGSALFDVGVAGATFTGVNFQNATVNGGNQLFAGGLISVANGPTTISASSFDGSVTAANIVGHRVGGLIGSVGSIPVTILDVDVTASIVGGVTESATAGGLIGASFGTVLINDASFTGSVTGGSGLQATAGGLVGSVVIGSVSISNSYSTATITGGNDLYASSGGFIGISQSVVTVESSYVTAVMAAGSGNRSAAGGMIGISMADVTVNRSYVTGSLLGGPGATSSTTAGGFIGYGCCGPPAAIQVSNSFVRLTANGGAGSDARVGGIVGGRQSNIALTTTVSNSYGEGTLTTGSGSQAWAFALADSSAPTISATTSFCVSVCESGGTGIGVTVSATNVVTTARSAGWNFDTIWCSSPSYNDGLPVLKGLTFGPNAAWGTCSTPTSAPAPSIVPVWSVTIDTGGGSCGEASGALSSTFIGYRYLPGAAECSRDGFVFTGWARSSSPTTVLNLPLLVDPTDGVKRYFFSESADLVAVWSAAPKPPAPISAFVAFANFFCGRCTSVWLIWPNPVEQPPANRVIVTDASSRELCAQGVVGVGQWTVCLLSGLTPGQTYSYRIAVTNGTTSSAPVSAQVTLNNRATGA